ncbi:MAG: hypothetical protein WCC52_09590 [Nitrosotalea sp.]
MSEISPVVGWVTDLLKSPDAVATIIASLLTFLGTTALNSARNKSLMQRNTLQFLLSKEEIKNTLDLQTLDDTPHHKQIKSIIYGSTVAITLILFFVIPQPIVLIFAIFVNMVLVLPTMIFSIILFAKISENSVRKYKFYRSFVYGFGFSGMVMSYYVFVNDLQFHHIRFLLGFIAYFLLPFFLDFNVMVNEKMHYTRYVSSKIKEKYAELPLIHISLKNKELDGKLFRIFNESLVIKQNNKETVVMWKDIETFSIDSSIEKPCVSNDTPKNEILGHVDSTCKVSNLCSKISKKFKILTEKFHYEKSQILPDTNHD